MGEESWVTCVLSDLDGVDALILVKSLKLSLTRKKLTVLLGVNVSDDMSNLLGDEFDFFLKIEDMFKPFPMPLPGKELVAIWRLTCFKKCVFLDPKIMVIKNVDALFEYSDFSSLDGKSNLDSNMFVCCPDLKRFKHFASQHGNTLDAAVFGDFLNGDEIELEWSYKLEDHLNTQGIRLYYTGGIQSFRTIEEQTGFTKNFQGLSPIQLYTQQILPLLDLQNGLNHISADLPSLNESQFITEAIGTSTLEEVDNFSDAIAVVGMSCRLPGANNPQEFWDLLVEERDAIRPFPSERPKSADARSAGLSSNIQAGFLNCPVDQFDAQFFGISPREAPLIDPQQRLLLEVTWESLEDAGINPQTLKGTDTGVFLGIWQGDYDRLLHTSTKTANDLFHRYLGNAFSATASRVSYCLGFHGPAVSLESGCSSSLGALHLACESLRKKETSLAISNGVNLILIGANPFTAKIQEEGEDTIVLSKDFKCKTFDESANGFVRAEGCCSLVLKRYVEARSDGDRILAVVRGSAMNNDGTGTSFGTPNATAQEQVFAQALQNAKVEPSEVSYLEAHGTGTPVGDPIEMEAIRRVYSKNRIEPLFIASVKTNVGHCEAVSGIAGVVKAILSLRNKMIPAHLNLNKLNPYINLDSIPAIIPQTLTQWTGAKRICAVSSFSMSATNVHVILQEAPELSSQLELQSTLDFTSLRPLIITVSAKSNEALQAVVASYLAYLETNPGVSLENFAYATNVTRAHFQYRLAVVASTIPEVISALKAERWTLGKASAQSKTAFLFPGQGSQYFGMGKEMAAKFPVFRAALERASKIFNQHLGVSLVEVLWENPEWLERTLYCQPAIVSVEYALAELWKSYGITPHVVLGHSLGENAAAIAAGVLSLEECLQMVIGKSRLVEPVKAGAMLAVGTNSANVNSLVDAFLKNKDSSWWIDVAAINSDTEVVVSGPTDVVKEFAAFCCNNRVNCTQVSASHAFHSRDLDVVLEDFGSKLKQILRERGNLKCNYMSATEARIVESGRELNYAYWQRHLRDTVQFSKAIQLLKDGFSTFVEIGPQPILLGLTMSNFEGYTEQERIFAPSSRKSDGKTFYDSLIKLYVSGVEINWKGQTPCRRSHLDLPHYPFQRSPYWLTDNDDEEDCFEGSPGKEKLHPLLGHEVFAPTPGHNYVNVLRTRDLPYLEDHKVAELIIYPAAAFVETIMAAGRQILQGGGKLKFPLVVKDFTIDGALDVEKAVEVYTRVEQREETDGVNYQVQLYRKFPGGTFKRNASGTYVPGATLPSRPQLDMNGIRGRCEYRDNVAERVYAAVGKRGIQFGPLFQSIQSAWVSTSNGETLTEIATSATACAAESDYICHPILLDALLQTRAFKIHLLSSSQSSSTENGIYLPVQISKIVWFPGKITDNLYVYCPPTGGKDEFTVTLVNSEGEPLVEMEGIELLQTTANAVINSVRSQNPEDVYLSGEAWRHVQTRTGNEVSNSVQLFQGVQIEDIELQALLADARRTYSMIPGLHDALTDAGSLAFAKAVRLCQWPCEVGSILEPNDWQKRLPKNVPPGIINSYFADCEAHGYFERIAEGEEKFRVIRPTPSIQQCDDAAEKVRNFKFDHNFEFRTVVLWIIKFCEDIPLILQGKLTPLESLFPSDPNKLSALKYYNDNPLYTHNCELAINLLMQSVGNCAAQAETKSTQVPVLRILEVGAGGGFATNLIISKLKAAGIAFKYKFTDVSPLFLDEAKKTLKHDEMTFGIFDAEKDPLSQGYLPNSYDVIVAFQVLHATRNLVESATNLRQVLSPGGKLFLAEFGGKLNAIDHTFGLLEGWWRFNDFRRENGHYTPAASGAEWSRVLHSSGYEDVHHVESIYKMMAISATKSLVPFRPTSIQAPPQWIIFSDGTSLSTQVAKTLRDQLRETTIRSIASTTSSPAEFERLLDSIDSHRLEGVLYFWTTEGVEGDPAVEQEQYTSKLLVLMQTCMKKKINPNLRIVTRAAYAIGDDEVSHPSKATLVGLTKSYRNECSDIPQMIDFGRTPYEGEASQLFSVLFESAAEELLAFRESKMYGLRFAEVLPRKPDTNLPNSDRYAFINPPSGSFADIAIGPAAAKEVIGKHVEIAVRATSLNFKDIFCVLKPDGFNIPAEHLNSVGLDVAGVVTRVGPDVTRLSVGDEVLGVCAGGGIASHVVMTEKAFWKKPRGMTFPEAAGLPTIYLTAYVGLVQLAKVTCDDNVLIHAGSGGVGLAAINVVRALGGKIYATAGSKRKRAYLRSIGLENVYNSRNTDYGVKIMEDTKGSGVHVVLNCLTSPGFKEASLECMARGGRFIEMSKLNIWSVEELKAQRPDVDYHIMDLTEMASDDGNDEGEYNRISEQLQSEFESGRFGPVPIKVFPLSQVQSSFYFLQEAKQIGKVIIKMPTTVTSGGKLAHFNHPFNPDSTYIITGGLGGIGLELAKWMTTKGAKFIILAGRSSPGPSAREVLENLAVKSKILVANVDIGNEAQCGDLFRLIKDLDLPPLRGIFHGAGVLHDDVFENQNWATMSTSLRPKAYGAWHLHNLTLGMKLEFFVLFSSVAAIFGSIGQSPHVTANTYLDALAWYRHSLGLPATSINWGVWENVGAAADLAVSLENTYGVRGFQPSQGFCALERIMGIDTPQVAFVPIRDWSIVKSVFSLGHYLDDVAIVQRTNDPFADLEERIAAIKAADPEVRQPMVQAFLERVIKQTLKLPPDEELDIDKPFNEMGLDSLMAMEMKGRIQKLITGTLPIAALQENRTIRKLSTYLAQAVNNESLPTPLDLTDLMKADSLLPPEIQIQGLTPAKNPSEFRGILLNGVTGHLGAHFLPELQRMNPGVTVHCLIRAGSDEAALKRLNETLKYYQLDEKVDLERVVAIAGDVSMDLFGLTPEKYELLSGIVDGVVHSAIKVNHFERYSDGSSGDTREANVIGLLQILKFVTSGTALKQLAYPSTLLCATELNEDFTLSEDWTATTAYETIDNGYVQSKLVAENLLLQASQRGIPCAVYRVPLLFSSLAAGVPTKSYNNFWNMVEIGMRLRKFPNMEHSGGIPIFPVDVAARICTEIWMKDSSETGMFNLTNNKELTSEMIVEIGRSTGMEVELVPLEEWREAMLEDLDDAVMVSFLALLKDSGDGVPNLMKIHHLGADYKKVSYKDFSEKTRRNIPNIDEINDYSPGEIFKSLLESSYQKILRGDFPIRK